MAVRTRRSGFSIYTTVSSMRCWRPWRRLNVMIPVTGGWLLTWWLFLLLMEHQQIAMNMQSAEQWDTINTSIPNNGYNISHDITNQSVDGNSSQTVSRHVVIVTRSPKVDVQSNPQDKHMGAGYIHKNLSKNSEHLKEPVQNEQIWPVRNDPDDRLLAQMKLHPKTNLHKVILLYAGYRAADVKANLFKESNCPVQNCLLSGDKKQVNIADVIVLKHDAVDYYVKSTQRLSRKPSQIVLWYMLESAMLDFNLQPGVVNWTATYRRDSTIYAPYEHFKFFGNYTGLPPPRRNYAEGKTKMAAWFVSNCNTSNGRTLYAKELQKYIEVDIYGGCSKLKCSVLDRETCSRMLSKDYKFYLAFENSNCIDYITEKFYWNGLFNDIVPVVMGARPEDYAKVAPPNSYIHVDDFESPRHLADYLMKLDKNDTLYNEYFRWKGTGDFINTIFWCRLCAMAHEADISHVRSYYHNLKKWWKGDGVCIKAENYTTWASWRHTPQTHSHTDPDTLQYIT